MVFRYHSKAYCEYHFWGNHPASRAEAIRKDATSAGGAGAAGIGAGDAVAIANLPPSVRIVLAHAAPVLAIAAAGAVCAAVCSGTDPW